MLLDRRDVPKDAGIQGRLLRAFWATLCLTVGATLAYTTVISQSSNIASHHPLPWIRLVIACALALLALWGGARMLWETARHSALLGLLVVAFACVATRFLSILAALPVYWMLGGTWFPGK